MSKMSFGHDFAESIVAVNPNVIMTPYTGGDFSYSGYTPDVVVNGKYNVKVIFQNTKIRNWKRDWSDVSLTIRNNNVIDHYLGYARYQNMVFVRINSENKRVFIYRYNSVKPSKSFDDSYYVMYSSGVCLKYTDNESLYKAIAKGLLTICK